MKKLIIILAAALMLSAPLSAQNDAQKKYVGIFYFIWQGQHPDQQDGIYDITKLLEEAPEDLWNVNGTSKSPAGKYHYWGQPLYGYYDSRDPWVATRHIELLMNAGIDYLMMDTTNAVWYPESISNLLDCLKKFADQGFDVPKVAFYTNTRSGFTVKKIYETFFKPGKWDGLFFCPNGRPLIIGSTENNKSSDQQGNMDYVSKEMQEYFDVHESQWPNAPFDEKAFPWISWDYPQKIHEDGVISVSVAQHSVEKILFSDTLTTRGRGYDAALGKNLHSEMRNGHNFQNQWNTALENKDKVDNVFVTGWNEWVALKLRNNEGTIFVDLFNEEFSRDAEMMKGGYGDNFYMQLADNIQRFKGECGIAAQHGVYRDPKGDVLNRNFKNFDGSGMYVDNSGRNDIVSIKVSNDAENIVFVVETADKITKYIKGDNGWMNILVKVGRPANNTFEYDYIINRKPASRGRTSVEAFKDGFKMRAGGARYTCKGNRLTVTVPIKVLGLSENNVHFSFKVADNVTNPDDIMEYYISGDSAPIGRMSFDY